jgi:Heavy metal associated domain 2
VATGGARGVVTAVLEHSAHGRVRVRLHRPHRTTDNYERIRRHLVAHADVQDVQVNTRTGSLLIQGSSGEAVQSVLGEVLDLMQPLADEESLEPEIDALVNAVKAADSRLRAATGGRVSLRWVVPAAFVSIGIRQLLAQGLTVGNVPWYVLIYYGVDSFLKLYPHHAPRPNIVGVTEVSR